MEEAKQCILVVIGADETGRKAIVAFVDGWRESEASWTELLLDLRARGCLSRHTAMTMVFKLIQNAQKRWRRLNASDYLKDVIPGVEFRDGVRADGQMEQEDKADAA